MRFSGLSTRSGPLTHGQTYIWRSLVKKKKEEEQRHPTRVIPLPVDFSPARLIAAVGDVLRAYEALRTLVRRAADGSYRQDVVGAGSLTIPIVRTGPDVRSYPKAEAFRPSVGFDHETEIPVRMRIVPGDRANYLLFMTISHLACDDFSMSVVEEHLRQALWCRRVDVTDCRQPLDQVAHEQSPAGRRESERALAFWRRQLRRYPAFTTPGRPAADPRFWQGTLTSAQIGDSVATLSAQSGLPPYIIAMTGVCLAYGRWYGTSVCPLTVIYNNRHIRALRRSVMNLARRVPVLVDLTPGSFLDIARGAREAAFEAYRYGFYPPYEMQGLLTDAETEQGGPLDTHRTFNPIPAVPDAAPGTPARQRSFRWTHRSEQDFERLWFIDYLEPDRLALYADTRYLPPPDIESFLNLVEEILVAAVRPAVAPGQRSPHG